MLRITYNSYLFSYYVVCVCVCVCGGGGGGGGGAMKASEN